MAENINCINDDTQENRENVLEAYGRPGSLLESINRSLEFAQTNGPYYQEGETKSTNHMIFEMNEFYLEMVQKINELSLQRYDNYVDEDEDVEDTDSVLYEVVSAIRKKRNDPEMRKQIETVLKLDKMMEDTFKTLKRERMERLQVQKELCDIIDREDETYSRTGYFRRLCDLESGPLNASAQQHPSEVPAEMVEAPPAEASAVKDTSSSKKEATFIKRNIQLAKNTPTMYNPAYSMTDAERTRLDNLLKDLDKTEESEDQGINTSFGNTDDSPKNTTTSLRPYSLSQQDQLRLHELDSKLEKLSKIDHKSTVKSTGTTSKSRTKRATTFVTKWQEDKCQERLKQINERLEKLQRERESFTFKPSTIVIPSQTEVGTASSNDEDNNDTINDVDSIPFDTLRARSQDILERISKIVKDNSDPVDDHSDYENDVPVRD